MREMAQISFRKISVIKVTKYLIRISCKIVDLQTLALVL